MGWIIDFCAQSLRNIIIGIGGRLDGFMMESKFGIAVGSELMAILAVAKDLKDLRERIGKIVVAYSKTGEPVTCEDLDVAGAMAAWMRNAINPTMCYSVEHQPVLIHAGPFANIAIGQSSVIADRLALKLFDYHVTESGFAADIGFEKFWNVKTRLSGLTPNVSVLVATVRSLKMHGGGPKVTPGAPLPKEYKEENLELLGIQIPFVTIPVKPGRNLASIVEVAAMNNRNRKMGHNAALELTQRMDRHFEKIMENEGEN